MHFINNLRNFSFKNLQIFNDYHPNNMQVNAKVLMNDSISQADDPPPLNRWELFFNFFFNSIGSLSYYLEIPDYGINSFFIP